MSQQVGERAREYAISIGVPIEAAEQDLRIFLFGARAVDVAGQRADSQTVQICIDVLPEPTVTPEPEPTDTSAPPPTEPPTATPPPPPTEEPLPMGAEEG